MTGPLRKKDKNLIGNGGEFTFADAARSQEAEATIHAASPVNPALNDLDYLRLDELPEVGDHYLNATNQDGGYNRIVRDEDGATTFMLGKWVHRTDGPAIFHADGTHEYRFQGHPISRPDIDVTGPQLNLRLESIEDITGKQTWAGDDGWVVTRARGGYTRFEKDGILHSDGRPAVVGSGLGDHWYVDGEEVASPFPGEPTESTRIGPDGGVYKTVAGSKYRERATVPTIAKHLRADLAQAVLCGVIPEDVSVDVRSSSKDLSLTIYLQAEEHVFNDRDGNRVPRNTLSRRVEASVLKIADGYKATTTNPDGSYSYNVDTHVGFSIVYPAGYKR